ncbi:hypothetical protein PRIPAC_97616 [Pristionchus pacificus]|uniref:Fatty-acid and retinol-binding protein 1 n=1 Tax=Pristionchus pacificus TaxID=54126 RepID=A0A2A6D2J7_PRIPA|nr:hypothetical protein PRIPAC_97616 [Pristionchus pacificus]|eukprot:PDM84654.1 hypothetical protein PRIPAC_33677 [Pristionchus pacificus]
MRFVLCAIVAAVIYGVPSLADRQQTIRAIFGDDTNVTRAEAILAEEAQKLGITVDDYFNSCAADAEAIELTKEEGAELKPEMESLANFLKDRAPKTYAIVMKRKEIFDKYFAKLDATAQQFVRNAGNALFESAKDVPIAEKNLKNIVNFITVIGKKVKQVKTEYDALPQSSKDSLERVFCIRGALRIADEYGLLKIAYAVVEAVA